MAKNNNNNNIFQLLQHGFDPLTKTKSIPNEEANETNTKILHLLQKEPQVANQKDKLGCTPLHYACSTNASLEVVSALLNAWPDAAKQTTKFNSTPLHYACTNNASLEVVSALLDVYPDATKVKDDSGGCLPLHRVCFGRDPKLNIVSALLHVWPDAAKETTACGNTALHFACSNKEPLEVVSALLNLYPEAVAQTNNRGHTLLHCACSGYAPLDVVSVLLVAWPDAVRQLDNHGNTPLHCACSRKAPLEIVSALLSLWPDSTKVQNNDGDTPLHRACHGRAPLDVVSALLSVWPDAVKKKNNYGHTLFYSKTSFEVTILLANTYLRDKENRCSSDLMPLEEQYFQPETPDEKMLFDCLYNLYNDKTDNPSPEEIMSFFIHFELWSGVAFVLDRHPTIVKTMDLDTKVMADFVFMVGCCCRLTTMWKMICNEQDLLEGV